MKSPRRKTAKVRSQLTEKDLHSLLLSFDNRNTRFTQDSPILPEVWVAFALNPDKAVDLLITPLAGTRFPKSNLVALRRDLAREFGDGASFAWLDECVLVSAKWHHLLRVLLPRTIWYQDLVHRRAQSPPKAAGAERERTWWWLMRLVAAIELCRGQARRLFIDLLKLPLPEILGDKELQAAVQKIANAILPDGSPRGGPAIYSISLNRPATRALDRSRLTVKADAAERVFGVKCANITWGVLDSGIDARHRGFRLRTADGKKEPAAFTADGRTNNTRIVATYDFSLFTQIFQAVTTGVFTGLPARVRRLARNAELVKNLRRNLAAGSDIPWHEFIAFLGIPHDRDYQTGNKEPDPHGTHVAGIIGADLDAGELVDSDLEGPLRGVCPDIRLIDLRVFGPDGAGDEFSILAALQFVRYLNRSSDRQRVHGVNLSLSLQHKVAYYACGSTPVCRECDRLVGSGVVVVAAAGNLGFADNGENWTQNAYRPISITDPGNAECVITVGSTHRESPHTYGVSYFSSRGPTGDGRSKPDLVAPGEKILSLKPDDGLATRDGTSMAAPHVSGVAAMLLARYPELAGQPARIKDLLCTTALDLRRERSFQGAGLVDALKALQSI